MKLATGKIGSQLEMISAGVWAAFSRLPVSWKGIGAIILAYAPYEGWALASDN